jgi:hypothetical protein
VHCIAGRCDLCAKELADELAAANKVLDLSIPTNDSVLVNNGLWTALVTLGVEIRRPLVRRRVERRFEKRTVVEIRKSRGKM